MYVLHVCNVCMGYMNVMFVWIICGINICAVYECTAVLRPPKQCTRVPPFSTPASINILAVGMQDRMLESPLK